LFDQFSDEQRGGRLAGLYDRDVTEPVVGAVMVDVHHELGAGERGSGHAWLVSHVEHEQQAAFGQRGYARYELAWLDQELEIARRLHGDRHRLAERFERALEAETAPESVPVGVDVAHDHDGTLPRLRYLRD